MGSSSSTDKFRPDRSWDDFVSALEDKIRATRIVIREEHKGDQYAEVMAEHIEFWLQTDVAEFLVGAFEYYATAIVDQTKVIPEKRRISNSSQDNNSSWKLEQHDVSKNFRWGSGRKKYLTKAGCRSLINDLLRSAERVAPKLYTAEYVQAMNHLPQQRASEKLARLKNEMACHFKNERKYNLDRITMDSMSELYSKEKKGDRQHHTRALWDRIRNALAETNLIADTAWIVAEYLYETKTVGRELFLRNFFSAFFELVNFDHIRQNVQALVL